MRIKICGITNEEDALKVVHYGAWAVGFVFDKKSPRYVSPSRARKIIEVFPEPQGDSQKPLRALIFSSQ